MIVIDASVALKWVLPEEDSITAKALLAQELVAPTLWLVESANALWRFANAGKLSSPEAQSRLTYLYNAPVTLVPTEDYARDALDLGVQLRHPIYDCVYLAAAIRAGTYVVTADTRFLTAVSRRRDLKRHVRLLGED